MEQNKRLKIVIDSINKVNYCLVHNGLKIINSITFINESDVTYHNLRVNISFEPFFAESSSFAISFIDRNQSIIERNVTVPIKFEFLHTLSEAFKANIIVEIFDGENLIARETKEIEVLTLDHWDGSTIAFQYLASFVLPNDNYVKEIFQKANLILNNDAPGLTFDGYNTNNKNVVTKECAAIYYALVQEGISYALCKPSFELCGQKIRLPNEIKKTKFATCLDSTLLFASILEAAGLNSILILIDEHAYLGVWLTDTNYSSVVIDDKAYIENKLKANELILLESTLITRKPAVSFENLVSTGAHNLNTKTKTFLAIDLRSARASSIKPLPLVCNDEGDYVVNETIDLDKPNLDYEIEEVGVIDTKINKDRFDIWEKKLLDLTTNNKLVSFVPGNKHFQLFTYDIYKFFDALLKENLTIYPDKTEIYKEVVNKIYDTNFDVNKTIFENDFGNQRIRLLVTDKRLPTVVRTLMNNAKSSLEESGSNTLFVTIGTLNYVDKGKTRYAPIILVPVSIFKNTNGRSYSLSFRDDEILVNNTLFEYLKVNYDLSFDELRNLPHDVETDTYDLKSYFNTLRRKITGIEGWTISESSFVGIFSFTRFIMWADLRNRKEDLLKNDIVKSLVDNSIAFKNENDPVNIDDLDLMLAPNRYAIPLMADSSQTEAIVDASRGLSFVLNGPPGTGKSQTITNMIINSLYNKKKVLFVAQKMAALEVVKKRLDETGIGQFCIELHSNKAQKVDVLNQIKRIVESGKYKKPEDYEIICAKLLQKRNELNEDIKKLHKKSENGFDLYDNITTFEKYKNDFKNIKINGINYSLIKKDDYIETINELEKFIKAKNAIGDQYIKLFSPIKLKEYSISNRSELSNTLTQYSLALFNYQNANQLYNKDASFITTRDNLLNLYNLVCLYEKNKELIIKDYVNFKDDVVKTMIESALFKIYENKDAYEFYKQYLSERVLDLDLNTLANDYYLLTTKNGLSKLSLGYTLKKSKIEKQIFAGSTYTGKLPRDQVYKLIENLKTISEGYQMLRPYEAIASMLFKENYTGKKTDIDNLLNRLTITNSFASIFNKIETTNLYDLLASIETYGIQKYKILVENTLEIENTLKNKFAFDVSTIPHTDYFVEMTNYISRLQNNLEKLKEYIIFSSTKEELEKRNIGNLIDLYLNDIIDDSSLIGSYEKDVNYSLAMIRISKDPDLNLFSGTKENGAIDAYRALINEYNEVTLKEVAARLSKNASTFFNSKNTKLSNEYVILNKAISNGARGISLRNLFDSIPNVLRELCPCFLMSPLSVAQYLDLKNEPFDIVIFDEASQITTSDAIGAIARGKSAIIVGDEKQLPPTSFFQANTSDEDDFFIEDGESVLSDCLNISMPKKYLSWHYRSKDESLIAFSNANYYDNRLLTFPSPNSINGSITYNFVEDGVYEKRCNKREAEEIIKEVVRRMKDEELSKKSIGIVTFSIAQQGLIEEELQKALRKDSNFEEAYYKQKEEMFIKNLENVQGDERDVIIFSICYGPSKDGKVSLNFGPLSTSGGEKRLNVAVSRAREEMLVYTCLRSEMIDLSRAQNNGSRGLKEFLEYARRGKSYILVKNGTQKEYKEGIEKYIASDIEKRGYKTRINVGTSDFRVDIAILDPNDESKFIMGVLCDSKSYVESKTAKDRNITQKAVLNRLGWKIMRIWSLDYFDSPNYVVDKIIEAIENPEFDSEIIDYNIPKIHFDKADTDVSMKHSIDYVSTRYLAKHDDPNQFLEEDDEAKRVIEYFIRNEAPISYHLLTKKVLAEFGISRNTKPYKDAFYRHLLGYKTTYTGSQAFYWLDELQYLNLSKYRVSNKEREFIDIPKEEIAIAISDIMRNKLSLNEAELIKEITNAFGFNKVSEVTRNVSIIGISYALEKKIIRQEEDGTYFYLSQVRIER